MSVLLLVHVMAVGIWLGCIATETVLEITREENIRQHQSVARTHRFIDQYVEVPAIVAVLGSGLVLFGQAQQPDWIKMKAALGLTAILLNVMCVYFVFMRCKHFEQGNERVALKFSGYQDISGAVMILCIIAAMAMGVYPVS